MAKMYYDGDADYKYLKGKKIGIIGYGSQGHAQAQNLRDSGLDVMVSDLPGTDNYKLAVSHGFKPVSAAEIAKKCDIIQILLPDELQARIYAAEIKPHLRRRMVFSTGDTVNPATQALFQTTGNLYLAKPFRLEEVDEIISRVLKECAGDPVPGTN